MHSVPPPKNLISNFILSYLWIIMVWELDLNQLCLEEIYRIEEMCPESESSHTLFTHSHFVPEIFVVSHCAPQMKWRGQKNFLKRKRGCHNNTDFPIRFRTVNLPLLEKPLAQLNSSSSIQDTANSRMFPKACADRFLLSSWTERNVIKYQGHGDTVSGLHSVVQFEISADSDGICDVVL